MPHFLTLKTCSLCHWWQGDYSVAQLFLRFWNLLLFSTGRKTEVFVESNIRLMFRTNLRLWVWGECSSPLESEGFWIVLKWPGCELDPHSCICPYPSHQTQESFYFSLSTVCWVYVARFCQRGSTGVASVRRCQKLPWCLIQPVPASSKMDLPLAKAKAISSGGSTSVIRYVRRGGKLRRERGVRICKRKNSADVKVSEGGRGGAPGAIAKIPLQLVVKTMVRQAVPLQSMEVHGGADIHLQPMEGPTLEQVDAWRKVWPHGDPMLEQVCWQDLWPHSRPTLEQSVPEGLNPIERTHAGAVHEELKPM